MGREKSPEEEGDVLVQVRGHTDRPVSLSHGEGLPRAPVGRRVTLGHPAAVTACTPKSQRKNGGCGESWSPPPMDRAGLWGVGWAGVCAWSLVRGEQGAPEGAPPPRPGR